MKIVIRAGGTGTRLWPWSTEKCPKQFLPMFEGRSCVQVAYHRFADAGLAGPKDIYVSVGKSHARLARKQLPQLSQDHVIVEPAKMDTTAAIGLETVVVAGDDPNVVIASLGSDHYVGKPEVFVKALRAAEEFLAGNPEFLLAIACEPARVETGYGHVKKGAALAECRGVTVYQVEEFTEKPDRPTAERYTRSGQYLWNANFFVWTSGALMGQLRELQPEMHAGLMEIQAARGTRRFRRVIERKYPTLKKIAIDYAVLEPASRKGRLATLPVAMDWSDIGSWATITDAFPPNAEGNLLVGPALVSGTRDTTIYVKNPSRRLVAAIGVEGLAIVETKNALLIVPRKRAGDVKHLVEELKKSDEFRDLV